MSRWRQARTLLADDTGASPVEFVLVGSLLTVLTLGILQIGVIMYVRNIAHDAAVSGAHRAALADATFQDGETRAREVLGGVGGNLKADISVKQTSDLGYPSVEVTVQTTLPVIGFFGIESALEVSAHAPIESFDP